MSSLSLTLQVGVRASGEKRRQWGFTSPLKRSRPGIPAGGSPPLMDPNISRALPLRLCH